MAGHRIVRSGFLRRFEHHHGQRRSDFRGPVFVQKHRESRRLPCLAVQIGRETLQSGQSWMRRECGRHRVRKTGDLEHGRVGGPHRRRRFKRCRPVLLEDYPRARWRDIRLGERHCDAALDPTAFADRHLRGRAKGDLVASGLHLDAMKPHARIGHRGAMHLERGLQSSRKPEKIGRIPFPRGSPGRVDSNGMKRDDQHPADKRGAIIHVPVRVCLREGYGKLSSWERITERAGAKLIAASGSHVRASDDSVRIDDEHSRRLPVRHAHHSIDLDRRTQFSRQLVFALH